MATVNDFTGRNCPFCGAEDSLEADEVMGEVACVECAKVVAMGLEESAMTRFNKDATYEDVDNYAGEEGGPCGGRAVGSDGVSRATAAALADGVILSRVGAGAADLSTEAGRAAQYAKTTLHPKMRQLIENLCRVSRRNEDVKVTALGIAKTFVGYRRAHGVKVEHLGEVAAACFLLATEINEDPVPQAELRVLDHSLKNVELRRREIVVDTKMEATEQHLRTVFAENLIRRYIRLLRLQRSAYEATCLALYRAIRRLGGAATDVASLVDSERVVAAVLLARYDWSIPWEEKPVADGSQQPPVTTSYAAFAATAHLPEQHVLKVMQTVKRHLPAIKTHLAALQSAPTTDKAPALKEEVVGIKRERPD